MAKKTTKKTGTTPGVDARSKRRDLDDATRKLEERQALRAIERAKVWTRLLEQLEGLLDHAHTLLMQGVPVDVTLGDVEAYEEIAATFDLAHDLQLAENWLPMIGSEYQSSHASAIADFRLRLIRDAPPVDPISTPAESLATAILCVRMLLQVDLARAKSSSSERAPVGVELKVLRALLSSPTALDGRAIAEKIGSRRESVSEKTVWDAVARLRAECRFKIDKTGAGYKLDESDRELARAYGISVEAVEVES